MKKLLFLILCCIFVQCSVNAMRPLLDVAEKAKDLMISYRLHLVIEERIIKHIEKILRSGFGVDQRCEGRETFLDLAVENGHSKVVQILLAAGADVNKRDGFFGTPPILVATLKGDVEVVRILLAAGADVNKQDESGNTALQMAAEYGKHEIVKLLLNANANIDLSGVKNCTALHLAATTGRHEIAKLLIQGVCPQIQALLGALHPRTGVNSLAKILPVYFYREVFSLLKRPCANIEQQDIEGNTPLHHASFQGHQKTMELLLNAHANAFQKNNRGETPLDTIKKQHCYSEKCFKVTRLIEDHMDRKAKLTLICALHPRLGQRSPEQLRQKHIVLNILQYIRPEDFSVQL